MTFLPHSIREVEAGDQPILSDLLYEALWDPPTSPRRPKSVLSNPHIAAYVQDWGSNATGLGFLAISHEGSIAGGILSRLLLPPLQGGAFYDAATPQLGIAVSPAFQKQGLGTSLFTRYLAAAATRFPRVSLVCVISMLFILPRYGGIAVMVGCASVLSAYVFVMPERFRSRRGSTSVGVRVLGTVS